MIPRPLAPLFDVALGASLTARRLAAEDLLPPDLMLAEVEDDRHRLAERLNPARDELAAAVGRRLADDLTGTVRALLAYRPRHRCQRYEVDMGPAMRPYFGAGDGPVTLTTWKATPASEERLLRLRMRARKLFERAAEMVGSADPIDRVVAAAMAAADQLPPEMAARVRRWLSAVKAGE